MLLQKTLTRNPKADMYVDLAELVTGLILVGFLWTHMLFVGTIIIGQDLFNTLSLALDEYYLSYVGIPFVICVLFLHMFMAGRRIPIRISEAKIVWRHAKMLNQYDTWTWVGQVITAVGILVLGSIHMWIILTDWPIEAIKSAMRVDSFYFYFYILLLLFGEYHAGFGIYRQFVKWGTMPRKPVGVVFKTITVAIIAIGLGALWVFKSIAGGAA